MRIVPISEVLGKDPKETVTSVKGTLTAVWPQNNGVSSVDGQPWTLQNCELQDSTGKIKLVISNRAEIPKSYRGKQVILCCKDGDKGLTGLKVEENTYRGNTTKQIKVTPTASLDIVDGNGNGNGNGNQQASQPSQVGSQDAPATNREQGFKAPPTQASQPTNGNGNGKSNGKDLDKAILAMGNVYLRCMDCATYIKKQFEEKHKEEGLKMTDDHFQGMSSTLFIAAQREGLIKF